MYVTKNIKQQSFLSNSSGTRLGNATRLFTFAFITKLGAKSNIILLLYKCKWNCNTHCIIELRNRNIQENDRAQLLLQPTEVRDYNWSPWMIQIFAHWQVKPVSF